MSNLAKVYCYVCCVHNTVQVCCLASMIYGNKERRELVISPGILRALPIFANFNWIVVYIWREEPISLIQKYART